MFYCACFTQDLVEYYKQHSLKEGFSSLDTTLQVPYRALSNGSVPKAITRSGSGESASQTFTFPSLRQCMTHATGSDLEPVTIESNSKLLLRPIWATVLLQLSSSDQVK